MVSRRGGPASATDHATPRSMRAMQPRPLRWAMSVALLDQGEIVPGRGVTTIVASSSAPVSARATREASRSRWSRSTTRSEVSPARTKWIQRAARSATAGSRSRTRSTRRSRRNAGRAQPPRNSRQVAGRGAGASMGRVRWSCGGRSRPLRARNGHGSIRAETRRSSDDQRPNVEGIGAGSGARGIGIRARRNPRGCQGHHREEDHEEGCAAKDGGGREDHQADDEDGGEVGENRLDQGRGVRDQEDARQGVGRGVRGRRRDRPGVRRRRWLRSSRRRWDRPGDDRGVFRGTRESATPGRAFHRSAAASGPDAPGRYVRGCGAGAGRWHGELAGLVGSLDHRRISRPRIPRGGGTRECGDERGGCHHTCAGSRNCANRRHAGTRQCNGDGRRRRPILVRPPSALSACPGHARHRT